MISLDVDLDLDLDLVLDVDERKNGLRADKLLIRLLYVPTCSVSVYFQVQVQLHVEIQD